MTVRWKHEPGDRYVLITSAVMGDPTRGYRVYYAAPSLVRHETLNAARNEGLKYCMSDDFNIGAIRDGVLRAITWMGEIVDDEPELIRHIAEEVML